MTQLEEQVQKQYGDNYVNILKSMAKEHTQAEMIRQVSKDTKMNINTHTIKKLLKKHNIQTAAKAQMPKKMKYEDIIINNQNKTIKELLKMIKGNGALPEDYRRTYNALNYAKTRLHKSGRI